MKEIIAEVNALSTGELIRANKQNPLFYSDHEAFGVIDEEVEESFIEAQKMCSYRAMFRDALHCDCEEDKRLGVTELRKAAVLCACEAIQVIAMCDKFFMSKEAKQ